MIGYGDMRGPFRIGMTDAERAVHVPGRGVQTDGVTHWTEKHMNLTRTLADDPRWAPRHCRWCGSTDWAVISFGVFRCAVCGKSP